MQIQLPSVAEARRAMTLWSERDERVDRLLARYGDPAPAMRHYGLMLWEEGALAPASQALIVAAVLKPFDAAVWGDLATVYCALGHADEAVACAMESLDRNTDQPRIWQLLGTIATSRGDVARSVECYTKAVEGDPTLVDAWAGLGLAHAGNKAMRAAITPLREAVRRGKAEDPLIQACLAQALEAAGDFAGAASAFAVACRVQPEHRTWRMRYARAQMAVDVIRGSLADALAACEALGLAAAEIDKTASECFNLLSAYEYRRAAIEIGAWRLARDPSDRTQAYLLAALEGLPTSRAPDDYIVGFFDRFADEFDEKLVNVLDYHVPEQLAALLMTTAARFETPTERILDVGCGTGLLGARLATTERRLTGVDLSPGMLEKARKRGCYEVLVEAELVSFLEDHALVYDIVTAADVLIYFGDLTAIFRGVARHLRPGGLFAFSVETATGDKEITHLSSGRFAHAYGHVSEAAARAGFAVVEHLPTDIRRDAPGPARGALVVLRRS